MGKSLLAANGSATTNVNNPAYGSISIAGMGGFSNTNEAIVQTPLRAAGTLRYLLARESASVAEAVTIRLNTADTALTCTPNGNVASDITHQVAVASGDLLSVKYSGATTATIQWNAASFEATAGHVAFWFGIGGGATTTVADTALRYAFLGRSGNVDATEANVKIKIRVAGTISNLAIYSISALTAGTTVIKSRVNGADGTQIITLTTVAGTGLIEDVTHSDTVAAGDDVCIVVDNTLGVHAGGTCGYSLLGMKFTAASGAANDIFSIGAGLTRAAGAGATTYSIVGRVVSQTETNASIQHGFPVRLSRMRCYVSANTYASDATVVLRVNAGNATQTFAITAGVTGLYEDTTHTDDVKPTDQVCWSVAGGTSGSITIQWFAITETDLSPALTSQVLS